MAATYYRLTFSSPVYTRPKSFSITPSRYSNGDGSINDEEAPISLFLCSISFTKKLFSPCTIEAVLQYSESVEYSSVVSRFRESPNVTLEFTKDGSSFVTIAKNYTVREIKPVFTKDSSGTVLKVKLKICSADVMLTDRIYCRTYVKAKLGDILDDAIPSTRKLGNDRLEVDHSNMQFLKYTNTKDAGDEFRHPYLVQYNESVYDLIARTANRCGEFLYFEDGKLNLGLKFTKGTDGVPVSTLISSYDSLQVNEDLRGRPADTSGSYVYDNRFVYGNENKSRGSSDYPINNEVAYDEYLGSFEKGKYDSFDGEDSVNCNIFADIFATLLQCTVWYDTLVDLIRMVGVRYGSDKKYAEDENSSFDKTFFKNGGDCESNKYATDQYNSDTTSLSQFKTHSSMVKTCNDIVKNKQIDNDFYDFVFSVENAIAGSNVEILMKSDKIQGIKLGDIIKVDEVKDSIYVVTEVCGDELPNGNVWSETMTVKAIKILKNKPVPPPCVSSFVRRGGTQTAYVKDITDPDRAGRVRLQFPWDPAKSLSPWARVAMSSANHDGAGEAYFKPSIGDEVLVEYVGGNMERPYVSGFIHNKTGLEYGGRSFTNVISTPGGQSIRQKDRNDGGAFWGSFSPMFDMVRQLVPGLDVGTNDNIKHLSGFTEITDTFGMYDIILSSEKRAVSINSPFGKVGINAYTGISIEAPNGDISISGKNVKIEAGNNISIVSGTNITSKGSITNALNGNFSGTDIAAGVAKKILFDEILAKVIDMKLIRCVIETAIKPVEGTLKIKSNRFLVMEAGEGNAQIPKYAYNMAKIDKIRKEHPERIEILLLEYLVNSTKRVAKEWSKSYVEKFNAVVAARQAYITAAGSEASLVESISPTQIIADSKEQARNYSTTTINNNYLPDNDNPLVSYDPALINSLKIAAEHLSSAANAFHTLTLAPPAATTLFQDKTDDFYRTIQNAANAAARETTIFPWFNKEGLDFKNRLQEIDVTSLFRFMALHVINAKKTACHLSVPGSEPNANNISDAQWDILTGNDGIRYDPPEKSILEKLFGPFIDAVEEYFKNAFQVFSDKGVWDTNQGKGGLLFSDKKDITARFNNGVLTEMSNFGGLDDGGSAKSGILGINYIKQSLHTKVKMNINDFLPQQEPEQNPMGNGIGNRVGNENEDVNNAVILQNLGERQEGEENQNGGENEQSLEESFDNIILTT